MDEKKASLISHLSDLQACFIKAIYGIVIGMIICYFFSDHIMLLLKKPMLRVMPSFASFVVLAPQEYFFTQLKAALFFGMILSSPWVFFQIWHFLAPGLYQQEKRMLIGFTLAASACFVMGVLFAYFLVFPPTFKFFVESLPTGVIGTYSVSMLYGFAITVLLAFGLIFQTPIAVFLLVIFDLVALETFSKHRRLVFTACFIIAAVLTPPDPITQVMLAIPAYLLFELGLFFSGLVKIKKLKLLN
jgi:sec-independent protein translocase protein TatC